MGKNPKQTSPKVACQAAKILREPKVTNAEKSVAALDLAQAGAKKKKLWSAAGRQGGSADPLPSATAATQRSVAGRPIPFHYLQLFPLGRRHFLRPCMMISSYSLRFDHVLATDGIARSFFELAKDEGLLYSTEGSELPGHGPTRRVLQAALTLLVLFDKVVIHDNVPGPPSNRIPDLERDGIIEVIGGTEPLQKSAPLKTTWIPSKHDPRGTPPLSLRRSLSLIQAYKPLILDRLVALKVEDNVAFAKQLGITTRSYYSYLTDYAISYAVGDEKGVAGNFLEKSFPAKMRKDFKRELFDFSRSGGDAISFVNATLIASIAFADELALIRELSSQQGLGVATSYYLRASKYPTRRDPTFSTDPARVPKTFGLVRSVLHEEGHFFPEIQDLNHALKLRANPHLQPFKQQLKHYHEELARGDHHALEKVRKEVSLAKRALRKAGAWNKALSWLTYISLPSGLAESLLAGPPILSTSLAVLAVAGTARTNRTIKHHEWAMFGS